MAETRLIKRYNAYYHGWCLAFGEHSAKYVDERDINWLFGDERIGLILSPELLKHAQRELLRHHDILPQLTLSNEYLKLNDFLHPLKDEVDTLNAPKLKAFLRGKDELHMYLTTHLFYPNKRIITFAKKKPVLIMYKEMQPLKLVLE